MPRGDHSGPEPSSATQLTSRGPAGPDYASTLAQIDSSGTNSSPIHVDSSSATQHSVSTSEDEQFRPLKELEASIESFRRGKTTKMSTISSVLRILGKDSNVSFTPAQKEASFDSYLAEILVIQSAFDDGSGVEKPASTELSTISSGVTSGKRSRRGHAAVDSDSEEDDDRPIKKQKLLESDMPWFSAVDVAGPGDSNPSCQETCRLLRVYNRDVAKAKLYVKFASNSPVGIPSSQWERIFKGEAADLNQIFASPLYHVIPDEERTGRLGDTEFAEAKKRVRTASEWSTAWRRASKAICFAFPHRREELLDYGEYIESLFAAKLPSSHHKLILYDIALRNEAAAGQHILLTDSHRFARLYSAIVMPDGVEGNTTQSTGSNSHANGGKPEICKKYNLGTCKQADSECKYRHACKGCKKPGHAKKYCPKESK